MDTDKKYYDKLLEKLALYPYKKEYEHKVGDICIDVPMIYGDATSIMCFFPINIEKTKKFIADPRVKPVPIFKNKTFLAINIFEYRKSQAGQFNEFTFSIPVMFDSVFVPPLIPLLFDQSFKKFGFYVIQLGASNNLGREHIKEIWGYPTYEKNLDISIKKENKKIISSIAENGNNILTMSESFLKDTKFSFEEKKFHTYFACEQETRHVELNTMLFGKTLLGKRDFTISLGDHPLSDILKYFGINQKSLTIFYLSAIEIAGKVKKI